MVAAELHSSEGGCGTSFMNWVPSGEQLAITWTMARALDAQILRVEIFPASQECISYVRTVLRKVAVDHPALEIILLLAVEVATNSVLYSRSEFFGLIIARAATGSLRVAIADAGRGGLPRLKDQTREEENGRGLHLLERLAQQWNITRRNGVGAAVWFDVK
jgi:anti-sigma regulatory factor (Ser/Thr protein kinase)